MSGDDADAAFALDLQLEEIALAFQLHGLNRGTRRVPLTPPWEHHASTSATTARERPEPPEFASDRDECEIAMAQEVASDREECEIAMEQEVDSDLEESEIAMEQEESIALALGSDPVAAPKECGICTETKPQFEFMSTLACEHEYCEECCKRHAEAKLESGSSEIPCPLVTCAHMYSMSQLQGLLTPQSFAILETRLTESAIPAALQVYCPFADCSVLMEKAEESRPGDTAFAECCACHRGLCQECRVAWHSGLTCAQWKAAERNGEVAGDEKLRKLAREQQWQKCGECARIIELAHGCHHITCVCGNEFCYVCGAKWKNRKATCRCKLWDVERFLGVD